MAEFVEVMNHKKRMCECKKPNCNQCDLYSLNNQTGDNCDYFIVRNYEQAEKIIIKWAKEHPVKTNEDKFKEIFELELDSLCNNISCDGKCDECDLYIFGNQEYKEPKGE